MPDPVHDTPESLPGHIPPSRAPAPGWFPDPTGRAPLRHWDGAAWVGWVSNGTSVWRERGDAGRALTPTDTAALVFVTDVFVPRAYRQGMLNGQQANALSALADQMAAQVDVTMPRAPALSTAAPIAPARTAPAPAEQRLPDVAALMRAADLPQPSVRRPEPERPYSGWSAQPREPLAPSAVEVWWGKTKDTIGSELAVHGLAYLGVLLLFIGVFGLVAFAFGDVAPVMRPVAELAAAAVPFVAARQLVGHGARVAGRAMEVVGGLLLPLMLVTSTVDGFAFPPDAHGNALVITLGLGCAGLAAAYAWWSRRHSDSGLRYAAAPTLWFGAAMATLAVGRPMPTGQDVAVPSGAQAAAMAVALMLTVAAARRWPATSISEPSRVAALPGAVVITVLALATWYGSGAGPVPVVVGGAALLVTGHLSRPRVPDAFLDLAGPVWWFLVAMTLLTWSASTAALVAVVGFAMLLEVAGRRTRPLSAFGLACAGLFIGLAGVLLGGAVWAAPVLGACAAWAIWRRTHGYGTPGTHPLVALLAAGLPIMTVAALHSLTDSTAVLLAGAAVLVVVGAVPPLTRAVSTGPTDLFWTFWWRCVLAASAGAGVLAWAMAHGIDQWAGLGTVAVCAVVAVFGPLGPVVRPWVVALFATTAWLGTCGTGPIQPWVGGVVLGAVALTLVCLARYPADGTPRRGQAGVALSGHTMAIVGIAATSGWAFVVTTALAVVGLGVTAWRDEHDRSVACAGAPAPLRHLPWVGVIIGMQVLVSTSAHLSGWVTATWNGPVITAVALMFAMSTRAPLPARAARVTPWTSFALLLVGLSFSWTSQAGIVALACLVGAVLVMARERRSPVMVWAAWVALVPLAGQTSRELWPWFAAQPAPSRLGLTLAGAGAALLVGAVLADLHGRPWLLRTTISHPQLRAPAIVGAVSVAGGLLVATLEMPYPQAQIVALGVAVVIFVVALASRVGSLAGLAVVVAWSGVASLCSAALYEQPWIAIATSTALLAAAPVAATALHTEPRLVTSVYCVVGLQVIATAVRLRRRTVLAEVLGWTGTALITMGAGHAGPGWLALALLALCVAHTSLAVAALQGVRTARQVIGALAGLSAWLVALTWFTWSVQVKVEATALGSAVLVLALVVVAAVTRLDRSWVVVWGATLVTVSISATGGDLVPSAHRAGWPAVAALACLTLTAAVGARALSASWLRDVSIGGCLATLVVALEVGGVPTSDRIVALSAVTIAVSVLALLLRGRNRLWDRSLAELGGGAAALALLVGLGNDTGVRTLVPAVAAAAVQVAVVGVVLRKVALQALGPVLGCLAWVLLMSDLGTTGPQWYTAAVGLALLAVVSLWRRDRRLQGQDVAVQQIVSLELLGIAFLVGGPFAQALTENVGHAFAATGIGVALGLWGAGTRVRRRVTTAVVVILASLVVVVAVPLVAILPAWGGAGMWIAVAVVGLGAVMGATMLERARSAVRASQGRIEAWTAGWE